jgi:peptidoglycan hydrolase CwlO-like protein
MDGCRIHEMTIDLPERCPHFKEAIAKLWCHDCVTTLHQALLDNLEKRNRQTIEIITKINQEEINELETSLKDIETSYAVLEDAIDKLHAEAEEKDITIAEQRSDLEALKDDVYIKEVKIESLETIIDSQLNDFNSIGSRDKY